MQITLRMHKDIDNVCYWYAREGDDLSRHLVEKLWDIGYVLSDELEEFVEKANSSGFSVRLVTAKVPVVINIADMVDLLEMLKPTMEAHAENMPEVEFDSADKLVSWLVGLIVNNPDARMAHAKELKCLRMW